MKLKVVIHSAKVGGYWAKVPTAIPGHATQGGCMQCGTRYYATNVLKTIEENIHGRQKASRQVITGLFLAGLTLYNCK